jgi:ferredoxin
LWSADATDSGFEVEVHVGEQQPRAFIGLRACDLAAIAIQDTVLRDGQYGDTAYIAARGPAFFVGVNCSRAVETCFCASMGTGPRVTTGHDLAITEVLDRDVHELIIEVGSDVGAEVLAEVAGLVASRDATVADHDRAAAVTAAAAAQQVRAIEPRSARAALADLEHPRWDDVAQRCLSCTNCTLVCPTCFCSAVEDLNALDGQRAERVQRWDSCFTLGHSELHGAGSVRGDTRARYRQWLTHKLSTWWDQFGESGCVGCGRCITWCPAGIDITEEVAAMGQGAIR